MGLKQLLVVDYDSWKTTKVLSQVKKRTEEYLEPDKKTKTSRKLISKEDDIMPNINRITEVIIDMGRLERGYKSISRDALREIKRQAFNLKEYIEKSLITGYKTPKEYKKHLKFYKEDKLYTCSLFGNVA